MKKLVTLIAIMTVLSLWNGCRRHSSTVEPYGWPSVSAEFDSLIRTAEEMFFIAADPEEVGMVVDSMKTVVSGLRGQKEINARAAIDYWTNYYFLLNGEQIRMEPYLDSIARLREGSHMMPDAYILERFKDFSRLFGNTKDKDTFRDLLRSLDYYRKINDLPTAGNMAVLLSNSLQFGGSPDLSLHYLQIADSLYALSGQEKRRMNVRLNEPNILCHVGRLEEGRAKMDALLQDSVALRDPIGREIMLRNHHFFFGDTASLFEGYHIIKQLTAEPHQPDYFRELLTLYETLLCDHYMDMERMDSASVYFNLSQNSEVLSDFHFQQRISAIRSRYLEKTGRFREAAEALKHCIAYYDTIKEQENPEKKEYLERVNALRQHEADAEREKNDLKRRHAFIGTLLVFLLLIAVIVVQRLRHKHKVKTMSMQLDAEKMERQILAMSLSKEETEKVLDKVKVETARLKEEGNITARELSEIEANIRMHMAGKEEMLAFEKAFAEVSPRFAERLKEISPTISQNNIRLCTYLYMGLSGQQVCGILNVTPGALRQAKRRLRQRFGLSGDDSLEDFLRSLES